MHPGQQLLISCTVLVVGAALIICDVAVHKSYEDSTKCISTENARSNFPAYFGLSLTAHIAFTASASAMLVASLVETAAYMSRCLEGEPNISRSPDTLVSTTAIAFTITSLVNCSIALVALVIFLVDTNDRMDCLHTRSFCWYLLSFLPGLLVIVVFAAAIVSFVVLGSIASLGWLVYLVSENVFKFIKLTSRFVAHKTMYSSLHSKESELVSSSASRTTGQAHDDIMKDGSTSA